MPVCTSSRLTTLTNTGRCSRSFLELAEEMPLVYDWLKHAEATRRLIRDNYQGYEGEALLAATIEENVLTQIENLRTYPAIHSKLHKGEITIYGWVYKIETGGVFVYSMERCNIQAQHEPLSTYEMEENINKVSI